MTTKVEDIPPFAPESPLLSRVALWKGDITKLAIDAVVNAANETLLGGGGVDGAIHRAAGPGLVKECRPLNGCKTGNAKITGGHKLPAKHIIHTVGPRGEQPVKLASCYNKSLTLAVENECRTIAFPCISTGIFGYPNEKAAEVVLKTVTHFLNGEMGASIDKVVFCLFLDKDVEIYNRLLSAYAKDSSSANAKTEEEDAQ